MSCFGSKVAGLGVAMAVCLTTWAISAQFAQPVQPGGTTAPPAKPAPRPSAAPVPPPDVLAIPGYWVLGMEGVQKELGLGDEQKQKLKDISDRWNKYDAAVRKAFEGIQDLPREEQQKRMASLREQAMQQMGAAQKLAEAALTPQQLKAVRQISFQLQAAGMLASPEIQRQLNLTEAQQQQLRDVYAQMQDKIQQLQREMAGKALGVLTPEQQAELRKEAAKGDRP